jgi:CRP/FNR family transcriptional regulator
MPTSIYVPTITEFAHGSPLEEEITMNPDSPLNPHCFEALTRSPLFKNLREETIHHMMLSFQRKTWPKNSAIGDRMRTSQRFWVLLSGRLKVYRANPETGREQTIFLLGPGDVFDVICLLDGEPHDVDATTIDDLEVLSAPLDEVRGWIERYPEFNHAFLRYLGEQIRQLEDLATDLSLYDTWTRLAKLLVTHLDPDHPQKLRLISDLSHEELASMTGSVRAVVNRHIQSLKEEGILKTGRKLLEITDLDKLLSKIEGGLGFK